MRSRFDFSPTFGLRARPALLWTIALVVMSCAPPHESEPANGAFPNGLDSYSVQMHIHGHSHHNGDPRPGSMQWHSHFAAENGLDVLWWSDHSEMFDLRSPLAMDFESTPSPGTRTRRELRQAGYLGSDGLSLALIKAPPEDVEWIEAEDRSAPNRRRLVARSDVASEQFAGTLYSISGPKGSPRGFLLPRPVSSGAVLSIDLQAGEITPDVRLDIEVALSWHHRGAARRHLLRYRLSPKSPELPQSSETAEPVKPRRRVDRDATVVITVPVPAQRTVMSFDLEKDAALLLDGTDNTITGIQVRLASRRGSRAVLDIFGLELSSTAPEPDHQLARLRRFAASYGAEYGHGQYVGVEFLANDEDFTHINGFLPEGALTGELASGDETIWADPAEFVRRVKALGGVTSFNHLFGTTTGRGRPRQEERRSRLRALELLDNGAYGTDVLEVGYVARGGVGLEYHLRTWDLLTARGLFLYGNGVSDAHGGEWGPRMTPNHFATWIWSEGPAADQLIAAIKRGRMVFGDPFADPGRLYFRVGDAEMGDRVPVRTERQELRVSVDERFDPARHRLYLVQGRIRPGKERVLYMTQNAETGYRRAIDAGDAGEGLRVDVSRPCFLRLELYDGEGRPLLFTNPIVFRDGV